MITCRALSLSEVKTNTPLFRNDGLAPREEKCAFRREVRSPEGEVIESRYTRFTGPCEDLIYVTGDRRDKFTVGDDPGYDLYNYRELPERSYESNRFSKSDSEEEDADYCPVCGELMY